MLSNFQQPLKNASFLFNHEAQSLNYSINRLTLSYDINNYQPLLQHLQASDDPRWILFIAPPGKPNFQFLQQAGIHKSRVITLVQKQLKNTEQVFKNALASNNYAAVIHWVPACEKPLINEINQLTQESKTHCFVYCAQ